MIRRILFALFAIVALAFMVQCWTDRHAPEPEPDFRIEDFPNRGRT